MYYKPLNIINYMTVSFIAVVMVITTIQPLTFIVNQEVLYEQYLI